MKDWDRELGREFFTSMLYGKVIQFFPQKGFGFIRADHGPDVFFHVSSLGACVAQPEAIRPGQAVKYELVPGTEPKGRRRSRREERPSEGGEPTGPKALLVELIDRIPGGSLDEQPSGTQLPRHPRARRQKPNWRR